MASDSPSSEFPVAASSHYDAEDNEDEEGQAAGEPEEQTNNEFEQQLMGLEDDGDVVEEEAVDAEESPADLIARIETAMREIFSTEDIGSITKKIVKARLAERFGESIVVQYKDEIQALMRSETERRLKEIEENAPDYLDKEGSDDDYSEEEAEADREGDEEADGDDDYNPSNRPSAAPSKKRNRKGSDEDEPAAKKSSALPAKPKNAYMWYSMRNRKSVQRENPDLPLTEVSKVLSEQWRSLTDEEKAEYQELARGDKNRFQAEIEKLRKVDPEAAERALGRKKKGSGEEKPRKKRKGEGAGSGSDNEGAEKKELSHFDSVMESLKSRKQVKSELSPEEQQELDRLFLLTMSQAAQKDDEANKKGEPAVHKLKLLKSVQEQLGKKHVATRLLQDGGLLKIIKHWLQFSSDSALPNVQLRTALYKILDYLNIDEFQLEHSGGLGRLIMKLWKHPQESEENKKFLAGMIERWMRPLLQIRTSYEGLVDHEEERYMEISQRAAILDSKKPLPRLATSRAAIPEPANFDYAIRPTSALQREEEEEEENGKKETELTRKQRMEKKLEKMRKTAGSQAKAKYKVDVSGGKTNLS